MGSPICKRDNWDNPLNGDLLSRVISHLLSEVILQDDINWGAKERNCRRIEFPNNRIRIVFLFLGRTLGNVHTRFGE